MSSLAPLFFIIFFFQQTVTCLKIVTLDLLPYDKMDQILSIFAGFYFVDLWEFLFSYGVFPVSPILLWAMKASD